MSHERRAQGAERGLVPCLREMARRGPGQDRLPCMRALPDDRALHEMRVRVDAAARNSAHLRQPVLQVALLQQEAREMIQIYRVRVCTMMGQQLMMRMFDTEAEMEQCYASLLKDDGLLDGVTGVDCVTVEMGQLCYGTWVVRTAEMVRVR